MIRLLVFAHLPLCQTIRLQVLSKTWDRSSKAFTDFIFGYYYNWCDDGNDEDNCYLDSRSSCVYDCANSKLDDGSNP
jgi:hypothetical protein